MAIKAFPPLATALGERGFATFRYDKRGVGASEGDYWATGFDDRLTDAVAAVGWLAARPEVDPLRIFVLGHSEGALICVRLAAGAAPMAGIVLLAGSAKTGEQILLWQGRQIASTLTGFNKWLVSALHIDPVKLQQKNLARVKATTDDVVRIQFQKVSAKWMREFLSFYPAIDLRIAEAESHRWLGEAEGLKVSLAGARAKLAEMDQITDRGNTTQLGMPTFTQAAVRTNISPPGHRNGP